MSLETFVNEARNLAAGRQPEEVAAEGLAQVDACGWQPTEDHNARVLAIILAECARLAELYPSQSEVVF